MISAPVVLAFALKTGFCASPHPASGPPAEAVITTLETLYGNHISLGADGEPRVAIGLMDGQSRVTVSGTAGMIATFVESRTGKSSERRLAPGIPMHIRVQDAVPALRQAYVEVDNASYAGARDPQEVLRTWRDRGLTEAKLLEEGAVLGLWGHTIDTRITRIVVPLESAAAAKAQASDIAARYHTRTQVNFRLSQLPRASLSVRSLRRSRAEPQRADIDGAVADSYVRLRPARNGLLQVTGVDFGVGYAWQGRRDRLYRGEVYAVVDASGQLAVVNVVGTESLLRGVVPAEMFASAHEEALKAQAIAARNIVMSKLAKRHLDAPYQLCSTQHCQVYAGTEKEHPATDAAVAATRGQVLYRRDHLVDAVYSSSCGGYTEDNDSVWPQNERPELRGRPDFDDHEIELQPFSQGINAENIDAWVSQSPATYCNKAPQVRPHRFRWQQTLTGPALSTLVAKVFPKLGRVRSMRIEKRGISGRVSLLTINAAGGRRHVRGELAIRQLLGNINSSAFGLTQTFDSAGYLDRVVIRGAGWGHGVGMCQLGAVGRAESGQNHRAILAHYYSGASLTQLYSPVEAFVTRPQDHRPLEDLGKASGRPLDALCHRWAPRPTLR